MNLGELVGIIIVLFVLGIGIAALTVLLDVLFPRFIRRARNTAEKMPIRSAIVGAINFIFFSIISLAAFAIAQEMEKDSARDLAGLPRLFGGIVVLFLFAFIAFGIAAIARWIGERSAPEASSPRQMINGIVTLELAALAPLVGWFLVPTLAILVGYGAVIIALVWRREA